MLSLPAIPGRVYFPLCSPTTLTVDPDTFYAAPLVLPRSRGFDQLGLRVTSGGGAGAAVRFAIYYDGNGRPGRLINQFNPVNAIGVGAVTAAFTPPLNLGASGTLWLACVFASATPTPTVAAIGTSPIIGAALGASSIAALPAADSALGVGVSGSMAYGAFPSEAPDTAPVVGLGAGVPLIGIRSI